MRMTRIVGLAVVVVAALCPAATAAADPSDPDPLPSQQLPGEQLPDEPEVGAPQALAATSCTYVVESGLYTCDAGMISRVTKATTVVATLYPAKGYVGAPTLTVRSEKGGCTAGKLRTELRVDLRYLYFTDGTHWDDKAMSFRTYAGCRLKLYDGTDGGEGRMPATSWLDDRSSMSKVDGRLWARRADLVAVS
ncbi:hypothetical protein [Nocardioides panacisoli]|uniref:Uncharacterized protein n=1 Tax=Nocardioides panacisoli TaxID=627624 RepID=A0ABP7I6Y5_9ACTN